MEPAAPQTGEPLTGMRPWFAFFLVWMIGLAAISRTAFEAYEGGSQAAMGVWLVAGFAFYLSLCNALMPLPTAWIIMLVAADSVLPLESRLLRVVTVALVGAAATTIANLNEYHILGHFLRSRVVRRIKRTGVYLWAVRWFDVSPFNTLMLVSFVPIPVDVVRWLAILRQYPRPRFATAYFCGRAMRYALLASLSIGLSLSPIKIILIQLGIALLLGAKLLWAALQRSRVSPPRADTS